MTTMMCGFDGGAAGAFAVVEVCAGALARAIGRALGEVLCVDAVLEPIVDVAPGADDDVDRGAVLVATVALVDDVEPVLVVARAEADDFGPLCALMAPEGLAPPIDVVSTTASTAAPSTIVVERTPVPT